MSETLTFARQYTTKSKAMKIYFTAFVLLFAILSMVHDSQEFSAAAGTTSGRRNFEKGLAYCEAIEDECRSLRQQFQRKQSKRLSKTWSNTGFEENVKE